MHLLVLIFGLVFLPKAYTLNCYECIPGLTGACTDIKQCPLGQQCGSLNVLSYAGGSNVSEFNMKTCVTSDQCVQGSVNFGIVRIVYASQCCTSDLCNAQPPPEPSTPSLNGKKCYGCDTQGCTAILSCLDSEDSCISTTVNAGGEKTTLKGCASKALCASSNANSFGAIGAEISCCQGNLCNSASSTSAGVLLLVAPLVSLVMFS